MPTGHGSREPWTHREEEIVDRFYMSRGVEAVADMLPGRTVDAIRLRAVKIGAAQNTPCGLRQPLADGDIIAALDLHDQGMGYEAIARLMGRDAQAVTNAVMRELCVRAGNTPAERDAAGGLLPAEKERIRGCIAAGKTGPEIQLLMGVSASCISHHRRRMMKEGLNPPPPGGGRRYSGHRVEKDLRREIDRLLLEGYGASKVSLITDIGVNFVKRARNRLIEQLARDGKVLPGCNADGRRLVVKESANFIRPERKQDVQSRLLAGHTVPRAAREAGVSTASAYKIRDALTLQLEAEGKQVPWAKAEPPAPAAPAPVPAPPSRRRRMTLEEQLAKIAAGARIVPVFNVRRVDPDMTLGGVGSAML